MIQDLSKKRAKSWLMKSKIYQMKHYALEWIVCPVRYIYHPLNNHDMDNIGGQHITEANTY